MLDTCNAPTKSNTEYLINPTINMAFPNIIMLLSHRFREFTEASNLAALLASHAPNRSMTTMGLTEIFLNAIEHGNLGIEYRTKSAFTNEKEWFAEINKRLLDKANLHKYVHVITEITPHYVKFTVSDQGQGFNFEKYASLTHVPLTDRNGRGILISKEAAFHKVAYFPPGNRVECIIYK